MARADLGKLVVDVDLGSAVADCMGRNGQHPASVALREQATSNAGRCSRPEDRSDAARANVKAEEGTCVRTGDLYQAAGLLDDS